MVGANLQGLVTAHDEANLARVLVLQESDITGSTLLPFLGLSVIAEKLSAADNKVLV